MRQTNFPQFQENRAFGISAAGITEDSEHTDRLFTTQAPHRVDPLAADAVGRTVREVFANLQVLAHEFSEAIHFLRSNQKPGTAHAFINRHVLTTVLYCVPDLVHENRSCTYDEITQMLQIDTSQARNAVTHTLGKLCKEAPSYKEARQRYGAEIDKTIKREVKAAVCYIAARAWLSHVNEHTTIYGDLNCDGNCPVLVPSDMLEHLPWIGEREVRAVLVNAQKVSPEEKHKKFRLGVAIDHASCAVTLNVAVALHKGDPSITSPDSVDVGKYVIGFAADSAAGSKIRLLPPIERIISGKDKVAKKFIARFSAEQLEVITRLLPDTIGASGAFTRLAFGVGPISYSGLYGARTIHDASPPFSTLLSRVFTGNKRGCENLLFPIGVLKAGVTSYTINLTSRSRQTFVNSGSMQDASFAIMAADNRGRIGELSVDFCDFPNKLIMKPQFMACYRPASSLAGRRQITYSTEDWLLGNPLSEPERIDLKNVALRKKEVKFDEGKASAHYMRLTIFSQEYLIGTEAFNIWHGNTKCTMSQFPETVGARLPESLDDIKSLDGELLEKGGRRILAFWPSGFSKPLRPILVIEKSTRGLTKLNLKEIAALDDWGSKDALFSWRQIS